MVTEQKINGKVMEGEVYYPSEEVIAKATLKDWETTAERALKDPLYNGFSSFRRLLVRSRMIQD